MDASGVDVEVVQMLWFFGGSIVCFAIAMFVFYVAVRAAVRDGIRLSGLSDMIGMRLYPDSYYDSRGSGESNGIAAND